MVNYGNGKIYKIEHVSGEGDIYIGSTTKEYLSQRMETHRSGYKRWINGKGRLIKSYELFERYAVENCHIVLLEAVQAQSKDELHAREAFWIRSLQCVNKNVPGRSKAEYRQDNKEEIQQKAKQYYTENKVELHQKMKEYYTENKVELLQKMKVYKQDNKVELLQKMKKKYSCPCGSTLRISEKATHARTQKHQQFIKGSPDSLKTEGVLPA